MIKISLPFLLLTVFFFSCRQKDHGEASSSALDSIIVKPEQTIKPAYADTVRINYHQNKIILEVLPLIPDSVFKTWEWSKPERQGMVDMLAAKNYFIDTTKNYNTIKNVSPDLFETQVVDGNFSLAAYRVADDDYIFIAKNQVGDGKNLAAYEYAQGRLSELNLNYLLGVYSNYFLSDLQDEECRKPLKKVWPFLDYDFETKNKIKISAPLDKKQAGACLAGNLLLLKFDPAYKRFDFDKIGWAGESIKASADSVDKR